MNSEDAAEYRETLGPAEREVFDVLERDVFAYHYYDDGAVKSLVAALVAAVYRGESDA